MPWAASNRHNGFLHQATCSVTPQRQAFGLKRFRQAATAMAATWLTLKRFDSAPQVHVVGVNGLLMALERGIKPAATHV